MRARRLGGAPALREWNRALWTADNICFKKMMDVRRISDGVMAVVLVSEEDMLRSFCGYARKYRSLEGKQSFCKFKNLLDMHCVDDLIVCLGKFNGHVERHINGFDGVYL